MFLVDIEPEIPVFITKIIIALPHWCEMRIWICRLFSGVLLPAILFVLLLLLPEPIYTKGSQKRYINFKFERLIAYHHWINELASLFDLFVDVCRFIMDAQ